MLLCEMTPDDFEEVGHLQKAAGLDPWAPDLLQNLFTQNVKGYLCKNKAYLFFRAFEDEVEVLSIGVDPRAQRQGLALMMLKKMVSDFKEARFFLEVAVTNSPALKLYEKCGFCSVRLRKNYYILNGKPVDALLMEYRRGGQKGLN